MLFSLGSEHQKKSTKSIYSCKQERNGSLFVCMHKSNLTQVTSTLKLYKMAMERERERDFFTDILVLGCQCSL